MSITKESSDYWSNEFNRLMQRKQRADEAQAAQVAAENERKRKTLAGETYDRKMSWFNLLDGLTKHH